MNRKSLKCENQYGFGMLEALAGLVVFMILAVVGTKAFKGVVANQKETAQVKALTDAVTVTAERLNTMSVAVLTAAGSKYLQWSAPEEVGSGQYHFRYRTVPRPSISGVQDTAVVGLEVETGFLEGGLFTPNRSFATLVAPHLSSKNALGQVSTKAERDAEAANYASLRVQIASANQQALIVNQVRLNSFNCYDQPPCCGFMKEYFSNPAIQPTDGMAEKCLYRCALGGAVPIADWNVSCNENFCGLAPWKTSEQCCAAIAAGECKSGSVCAQVCIDCVKQDGSTCAAGNLKCESNYFNDFFDCANETFCNGSPMPDYFAGWGDVKAMCKIPKCAAVNSECQQRLPTCCREYWSKINRGETPASEVEICKTISDGSECCNLPIRESDWYPIYCGTDGKMISAYNQVDGKWYCGMTGAGWSSICGSTKGCPSTFKPAGAPNVCAAWAGVPIDGPWDATYPKPVVTVTTPVAAPAVVTPISTPTSKIDIVAPERIPSKRGGGIWGNQGGRE